MYASKEKNMKQLALKIIYKRLAKIAQMMIKKHHPFVIAITGSVGKTSTKEAVTAILKLRFGDQLRATYGNLNAEIGIPLTVLGYREQPLKSQWPLFLLKIKKHLKDKTYPKYLVLEMGVEHPGDIKSFCQIAPPNIAIITAATPAHLANFSDLSQMQKEKLSLANFVKDDGALVYNADDGYLRDRVVGNSKISYAIGVETAAIRAEEIKVGLTGNKYVLNCSGERVEINSKLVGRQMIYADLAAAAVANHLKFSMSDIKRGLESLKPYPGRFNILPGTKDITIIDDSYNASPAAVRAAADNLSEIKFRGRKVFILGNMNELGATSEAEHIAAAKYIDGKANLIVLAGPNANAMAEKISKSGKMVFGSRLEIENNLDKIVDQGDLVLIKASQNNNYFEEIVKLLLNKNIDPQDVLVRQGRQWVGKK